MSRLVHELYAPTASGGATYATPEGGIVQVPQDFAFADTVVAMDDEIPTAPLSNNPLSQPPVSGQPMYGEEPWGGQLYETSDEGRWGSPQMHYLQPRQTALTGPPPPPSYAPLPPNLPPNAGLVMQARSVYVRAKNEVDSSRHEMKELWQATYDDAEAARLANEEDPFLRLAGKLRRVRAMFSFFEWDRADLMRAAWIGVAVFVIVATVGAFALQR